MPRERSGPLETADSGATLTNARVSAVLVEIADLLEIGGESSFKVGAYRRAADSVARSGTDVAQAYREGNPPRLRGIGGSIGERIEELVTTLDMEDFIDRRTEGFSQGQRVKVAIARAMVHRPQTVLMDEPSNGLDVMSTRALREYVRSLRSAGHSVVLSTHIMQEVAALCDRIVIIAKGEVAADGTAEQLLERAGCESLEDAFVKLIGSEEGLLA